MSGANAPIPVFFDVEAMLERSLPRRRNMWVWPMAAGTMAVVFSTLLIASNRPESAPAMTVLAALAMIGFVFGFGLIGYLHASEARRQRAQIEAIEELVTLRQWSAAASALSDLLARPMAEHGPRIEALVYLASVLSRYHQFTDAIEVHEYLLDHVQMQPGLEVTVRLARAMALLREDRLVDADRAISELRRMPAADQIAGVALVELYRDVKTGHPEEAVELFQRRQSQFGPQLGHRAADAYVLAAKAFMMIGDETSAGACYRRATLLAPVVELERRYPETADLATTFRPAPAPPEAA